MRVFRSFMRLCSTSGTSALDIIHMVAMIPLSASNLASRLVASEAGQFYISRLKTMTKLTSFHQIVALVSQIDLAAVAYMAIVHALALLALMHIPTCKWQTWVFAGALYHMSVLGITAGAHRLWAHKSYKAHGFVRFVLMLWNSIAHQGSIFEWSRWHRMHHRYAETDLDPHNIHRGAFHAHMGWRLLHPSPDILAALAKIPSDDLLQDWVVDFQDRFSNALNPLLCFGLPAVVAPLVWDEDAFVAFLVAGCLRHVLAMHATWLPNSTFYGSRPYNPSVCACDSPVVSFVTLGDGWQNWHHQFPQDYAASEHPWQFNPTKGFIDMCAMWGLAGQRQRALHLWGQKKWVLRSRSSVIDDVRPMRLAQETQPVSPK
ncbi:hypothetical protein AC1031_018079 [Aphanomyces cochlioides]|nr:hypothetical protein AC1031_018079 [Aphanomyces cochlioides]